MEYAIEIKNVAKQYSRFRLDNISFQVPSGCIMGLVGANGAGKTTTIKAILNLIHTDGGEITVFGQDSKRAEKEIKSQIGVVYDDLYIPNALTAKQVGTFFADLYPNWDAALYEDYLRRFDLPDKKKIKEFSRGMRMKLSIATALSHHPKLLLLDEPTSGLDPIVRNEILDIFQDFIQDDEHTILFSSHITGDLEKIADYITFLQRGQVVFCRQKDELLENHAILHCGEAEFSKLSRENYVGYRKNQFAYDVLTATPAAVRQLLPDCALDRATIEDIMLYQTKEVI